MIKVDNAIIMAAGTSSRFAPLSFEKHKAMTLVKGEILVERQIEQLRESGVPEIYIVTGYKAEQFDYLSEKYGVKLIHNSDYLTRNNNGSIWAAREVIANSYVCSADNYFSSNPFEMRIDEAYYAAEYADGYTNEWCMKEDEEGYISSVSIGGEKAWYMLGHTFWSQAFSKQFLSVLEDVYDLPETKNMLWETIFANHLDKLKMSIRKYPPGIIYEFDTLDELREFDESYKTDTRSRILKEVARKLAVSEEDMVDIECVKGDDNEAIGFEFDCPLGHFIYYYNTSEITKKGE